MAEYAEVTNGVCTNVIIVDASHVATIPGTWIDITDEAGVGIGWSWDGSTWTAPAVVVPQPSDDELKAAAMDLANKIALRETVAAKIDALPDAEKATLAFLYDQWSGDGVAYKTGNIVRVGDAPYRVLQDHMSQADWTPATAASLFTPLRVVSVTAPDEWVLPTGGHDAYNTGDHVTFESMVYESLIDANVWSPVDYPAGWRLVS